SAQENPTLNLLVERDTLTLHIVTGPVWLGDLEFRAVDGRGGIRSVRLMDDFDALQITGGYAEAGSCFVYRLSGATPPLPGTCSQINRVFRRDIARADVFWYDNVGSRARTVTVFGSGAGLTGEPCPPDIPDCPLVWEVTPSPMPLLTEMPVIPPTATSTPTLDPLQAALELARTPVLHNADWTPVTHTFDGVEMVLVPAGCFEMGNDPEAYYWDDKTNQSVQGVPDGGQQCFDDPFWLDKTEVTNAHYKQCVDAGSCTPPEYPPEYRNAYYDAVYADHPVVYVSWSQAQTYAEWRGGTLPTEREWEYVARGPEALFFPWGNEFVPDDKVVYGENSDWQAAIVGSKPGGASWVGALDLSGNIWEWVGNAYAAYPYDQDDRRESGNRTDDLYVLRGGSWGDSVSSFLRAANRIRVTSGDSGLTRGFRCVRLP
ncbi:MAG TPA: formylglycine-generating enzyme family protein, partial [Phototrophicaceae bacterium]|nr:formylglycine-generating enzyme family protein [Phototrophicaceae bacterium]